MQNTRIIQEGTFSQLALPNGWVEQSASEASAPILFYKTATTHMQTAGHGLNSTAPLRITRCVQISAVHFHRLTG